MQIRKRIEGSMIHVEVEGRLDANNSDHLQSNLNELIRQGARQILLSLSLVEYLSSAGIRVLLTTFKQLQSLKGSFAISQASPAVESVVSLVGLSALFQRSEGEAERIVKDDEPFRTLDRPEAVFKVFRNSSCRNSTQPWRMVGAPDRLHSGAFTHSDCRRISFPENAMGLGLGAFGSGYEDCIHRFGEFLAVAGHVVCLPADAPDTPDFTIREESLVPRAQVLYAMTGSGDYPFFLDFQGKGETGRVKLSGLCDVCMELCESDAVSLFFLGEISGLVGYSYRRSAPLAAHPDDIFSFPSIRDWIHYSSEPAYGGSLALSVGVASRQGGLPSQFLRPLNREQSVLGHVHAAVFPYRPLAGGYQEPAKCVKSLFQGQGPTGLLHLLSDLREINGMGESEFVRGLCWTSPVKLEEEPSQ